MGPKKVYYPDVIENRRILGGNRLGEEMFEADPTTKQICLVINQTTIQNLIILFFKYNYFYLII